MAFLFSCYWRDITSDTYDPTIISNSNNFQDMKISNQNKSAIVFDTSHFTFGGSPSSSMSGDAGAEVTHLTSRLRIRCAVIHFVISFSPSDVRDESLRFLMFFFGVGRHVAYLPAYTKQNDFTSFSCFSRVFPVICPDQSQVPDKCSQVPCSRPRFHFWLRRRHRLNCHILAAIEASNSLT